MKKCLFLVVVVAWYFFSLLHSPFYLLSTLYCETTTLSSAIDTPTAEVVEYSNYDLSFRSHGGGGILSRMTFGVFKPINIGGSWDIDKLVATGSEKVDVRPPAIFFKAKVFAGGFTIPAIAIGYDGQGYGEYISSDTDKYQCREKGIFLVFTREYLVPGFELSFGGNIFDFKNDGLYGFVSANISLEDKVFLIGEYDNIRKAPKNRANLGMKLFVTDNVSVEIAGRDLFKGPQSERIAIVDYIGKF